MSKWNLIKPEVLEKNPDLFSSFSFPSFFLLQWIVRLSNTLSLSCTLLPFLPIYFSRKMTELSEKVSAGSVLLLGSASLFIVRGELFHPPLKMRARSFLQHWVSVCQMNICADCCSAPHGCHCYAVLILTVTPLLSGGHNEKLIGSFFLGCLIC